MAERRPLTARDIKSTVEGYSEMSDEAFARRFYSDRTELVALGVPLHSQRDEFTGEELYTLRSENYFLERLDLDDDERSFRLDRMRSATLLDEEFEPREEFEPGHLEGALVARVLYSPAGSPNCHDARPR